MKYIGEKEGGTCITRGCGDTMYIIYCGVEHKGNQLTALHPLHLDPTRGLLQFPRAQNISPLGHRAIITFGSNFMGKWRGNLFEFLFMEVFLYHLFLI